MLPSNDVHHTGGIFGLKKQLHPKSYKSLFSRFLPTAGNESRGCSEVDVRRSLGGDWWRLLDKEDERSRSPCRMVPTGAIKTCPFLKHTARLR
ncbi:hypothetical protein NL676_013539 [Syzygium grande]|nr:hypothetical protein NL676_013539 [Syzygium grande]